MDFSHICPRYEKAVDLLGKRWTGLIVRVLMGGPRRFKELQEQMPQVSARVLSKRLEELEDAGILQRKVYPERPVRVEYELTPKGEDLAPVVEAIQRWAEKHM